MKPLSILFVLLLAIFLSSCSGFIAGITGQPVATTAVQRAGQPQAPIIMVSSSDLAQAEEEAKSAEASGSKKKALGLYDAGWVAEQVGQVIEVSGK